MIIHEGAGQTEVDWEVEVPDSTHSTISEVSSGIDTPLLYDYVRLDLDEYNLGNYKNAEPDIEYRLTRMETMGQIGKIQPYDYAWLTRAQNVINKTEYLRKKGILVLDEAIFNYDKVEKDKMFPSTMTWDILLSGGVLVVPSEEAIKTTEFVVETFENIVDTVDFFASGAWVKWAVIAGVSIIAILIVGAIGLQYGKAYISQKAVKRANK